MSNHREGNREKIETFALMGRLLGYTFILYLKEDVKKVITVYTPYYKNKQTEQVDFLKTNYIS